MITFQLFLDYSKQNLWIVLSYIICILLSYGLESIVLPRYSANLFTLFKSNIPNKFQQLLYTFLHITILWVIIQVFLAYTGFIESKIYPDIWVYLRNYIMKNILYRYETDYQDLELGKIITELNTIPGNFADFLSLFFENMFPRILIIFFILIYYFYVKWEIGLVASILIGIVVYLYCTKLQTCVSLSHERYQFFGKINESVQDKLTNLATIYSSGQVDTEINENEKENIQFGSIYSQQMNCTNTIKIYSYIFNTILFVCINGLALYFYKKGKIASTIFIAIFMTNLYFINYLVRLTYQIPSVVLKMGIIQKTDEFLESIQTIHKPSTFSQKLNIQQGDITFENVSFSYSKNLPILKNINLRIYPNTKVCIIGQSGSGKSTLLKLLLKFYIPTSGTIYIDGKNIQDYDTNHLRKQISYVNQNTKLFNKSIYENIQYSNPNLTTQMIDHKIQEYGIQDIFKNINYNLQTSVGVQGNKLSGGQRQAIIILRELLNPSKILILDEPTASIDETNKQYIYQLIDKMKNEKTIIVITHDLHNLELYDQIYLLKNYQLTPYTTPL